MTDRRYQNVGKMAHAQRLTLADKLEHEIPLMCEMLTEELKKRIYIMRHPTLQNGTVTGACMIRFPHIDEWNPALHAVAWVEIDTNPVHWDLGHWLDNGYYVPDTEEDTMNELDFDQAIREVKHAIQVMKDLGVLGEEDTHGQDLIAKLEQLRDEHQPTETKEK